MSHTRHALIVAAAVLSGAVASASAGMVYVNSPLATVSGSNGSTAQAKMRFSATNWDQSLDRGVGTSSGNFISQNLGNNSQITNRTFHFSLSHVPGEGFVFTMLNASNGTSTTLAWGSFATPVVGTVTPTINGATPTAAFNGLQIEARATRANSELSFRELAFTSPTLLIASGAFETGAVTPTTGRSGDAPGFFIQRLVADTNLAAHRWNFSGLLTGVRDSGSGGDEEVKFTAGTQNFIASIPVPAPGAAALVMIAGAAAAGRRVRSVPV